MNLLSVFATLSSLALPASYVSVPSGGSGKEYHEGLVELVVLVGRFVGPISNAMAASCSVVIPRSLVAFHDW